MWWHSAIVRSGATLTNTSTDGANLEKCVIVLATPSISGSASSTSRVVSSMSFGVGAAGARAHEPFETPLRTRTLHSLTSSTAVSTACCTQAASWSAAEAVHTYSSGATSTSTSQWLPIERARAPSTATVPCTPRAAFRIFPTIASSVVSVSWPRASAATPAPILRTITATPSAATGSRTGKPMRAPRTPNRATTEDHASLRWCLAFAWMTGEFNFLPTTAVAR
mmetsp:Transcript_26835/g.68188  ORF Transcript_26835/g.68188 Transcript_26835/m.68188 type:complete len:224 (-) Transcript_26835:470-1141(-)